MLETFFITKAGFDKIRAELKHLETVARPAIISRIEEARKHGDLSENAEYKAAKEDQSMLDSKINSLSSAIASAVVVSAADITDKSIVRFGACVKLENLDGGTPKTFTIVSRYEIDTANGLISTETPIAKEMIGKKLGEGVHILGQDYEIVEIKYDI